MHFSRHCAGLTAAPRKFKSPFPPIPQDGHRVRRFLGGEQPSFTRGARICSLPGRGACTRSRLERSLGGPEQRIGADRRAGGVLHPQIGHERAEARHALELHSQRLAFTAAASASTKCNRG